MRQNSLSFQHPGLLRCFSKFASIPKLFVSFALLFAFFSNTAFAGGGTDCGYVVDLASVSYANGQTKFVWTVYNPKPGNGTSGTLQDLSHFGVVLPTCVDPKDIVSGGSYGVDKSQDCYTSPYLKFDYGTNGKTKTTYTLVLNGKYTTGTTTGVFKSGSKTGCCTKQIQGVGCKVTCTPPTCEIKGNPVICNDGSTTGSTTLTATGGVSYKWMGPNNFTSTDATINVFIPGTYTVVVTGAGGCTSTCSKTVTVENPICSISGDDKICSGGTATLTASGGVSYQWTGPNGYTATGATIVVSAPGTYFVKLTTAGGCTRTCDKTITDGGPKPDCKITGNNIITTGGTATFTASGGVSYEWKGPGGFTATGATISGLTVPGTYTVTVTSANGCKSTCSVVLTVNPYTSSKCTYVVTLEKVEYVNGQTKFVWSVYNPNPGNGTNGTNQDLSHFGITLPTCVDLKDIVSGGSYGVDKSQDCYTSPYVKFDYGTNGNAKSLYTLVLKGKYGVGTVTAIFKSGSKTGCCTVQIQGVGCKEDCVPPTCNITGNPYICNNGSTTGSTTLTATGGVSYSWTGPNGFTATSATIEVFQPGIYKVTVTGQNGCTSMCSKEVAVVQAPSCTITGNTIICNPYPSVQNSTYLSGPDGVDLTYYWLYPDGTVMTTKTIQVYNPGVYYLTVTNKNDCSSTCSVNVEVKFPPECVAPTTVNKNTSATPKDGGNTVTQRTENVIVTTMPNPFQDRVRFVIQSKVSGKTVLEVYNMAGVKLRTVYQGYVEAGRDQVVEYNAKGTPKTHLVYKLQVGNQQVSGKLISIN